MALRRSGSSDSRGGVSGASAPAPQSVAAPKQPLATTASEPDKTDVFSFMHIRAPQTLEAATLQRDYIHDRAPATSAERAQWVDVDFQSPTSPSAVGHAVYEAVFCGVGDASGAGGYARFLPALLALLTPYYAPCDDRPPPTPSAGSRPPMPLKVADLERHAYLYWNNLWYLLPDHLELIEGFSGGEALQAAGRRLALAATTTALDVATLDKDLAALWSQPSLHQWVFNDGNYFQVYADYRRRLFDALYLLYLLRRSVDVRFDDLIASLRTLHAVEALAIDEFIAGLVGGTPTAADQLLLSTLTIVFPSLTGWDFSALPDGFPLVSTADDLAQYLQANPVIHPLFARLFYYIYPFNDIKPIGIGDLKVVKQWLVGYVKGEISDIHNIMLGESKTRVHRRLEKTDQTFSFTSDQQQESTKDVQSTDRFEVKREAQNIVKQDLNATANANVQYKGATVTANVGGSFSYGQSTTDDTKTAQNYAHEVVSKAVTRVQSRMTETRTVTQIFETRELNKHVFDNVSGTGHVSGIYRWLDKKYRAQLYNFGKRMMFEFILPEPAALYVESRLRAYEVSVDCPQPPTAPVLTTLTMDFGPGDIDYAKFNQLRQKYELAEFTYPVSPRSVAFVDSATNQDSFREDNLQGASDQKWYFKTFQCSVGAKGYQITDLSNFTGQLYFIRTKGTSYRDEPYFKVFIDGTQIFFADYHDPDGKHPNIEFVNAGDLPAANLPLLMASDTVDVTFGFQNIEHYSFAIVATIEIGPQALLDWQTQVFNKVRGILQKAVDDANNELVLAYNTAMNTYRNRLDEIKGTVINDLLQGRSEAFNSDIIRTELKRQCLSFFTKEFDANPSEGILTDLETVGTREVDFDYRHLTIHKESGTVTIDGPPPTHTARYPLPDLSPARRKGRYVQFLEQAFEWQELSYIFYPYFWSTPPKWISLMNRSDTTDPNLTAFLQAGSARILIAVSPAYDTAVLHFLATREPWNGGPAPVIGDPLYLPLYEELKNQQDDLANAVPEGDPWTFRLPTSLVYLEGSTTPLPDYPSDAPPNP